MFYKVMWHNMQPIKPGTPGQTLFSLRSMHWVLLRALHSTRDQRLYVPCEGQKCNAMYTVTDSKRAVIFQVDKIQLV